MWKIRTNRNPSVSSHRAATVESLERREMFAISYAAPEPPPSDGVLVGVLAVQKVREPAAVNPDGSGPAPAPGGVNASTITCRKAGGSQQEYY